MVDSTPSQTIGPFFHAALVQAGDNVLVDAATEGTRIRVEGRVLDGAGAPVSDAMVEIWQANAQGRYNHAGDSQDKPLDAGFSGYGRAASDAAGLFWFETVKPGPVPGPGNAPQAPHLNLTVFARGMKSPVKTRLYFADEDTNAIDPVLGGIADEARRGSLIAERQERGGSPVYRLDIHLQGEAETVFFAA